MHLTFIVQIEKIYFICTLKISVARPARNKYFKAPPFWIYLSWLIQSKFEKTIKPHTANSLLLMILLWRRNNSDQFLATVVLTIMVGLCVQLCYPGDLRLQCSCKRTTPAFIHGLTTFLRIIIRICDFSHTSFHK